MAPHIFIALCFALGSTTLKPQDFEIVTTTAMVGDIAEHVVGDRGSINSLMGVGVDPHLYKPTAADAKKILSCDIVFYSGLMLEGRMTDTFMKAARIGKRVYPVTELIDENFLLEPEEMEGHWDPHVWMDVSAWSHAVDAVANAMCEQDVEHCNDYQERAAAYKKELSALHLYIQQSISSIPKERRVLITAHDAFNYFGRAYGIEVIGIQGLSTESEAGIDDMNKLVDLLVAKQIQAVFVESSVSDRNVIALIEGAKARGHEVRIGGRLFSDAMGESETYEGTYIGMLDHNATTISRALGGDAPVGGMQNKLANHTSNGHK
ncbi:MAG: zinc ABC transporter substrate-binding protein [Phycisphaerales bacterium]|jgi:manganese/zinc/iron transport system substrate-binding protein|nr:zinc ABC transporter substrate-binding protein [Phycisphaerales bacterium]